MANAMRTVRLTQPLEGRQAAGAGVLITPADPAFRLSLRAPQKSVPALTKALGIALPQKPKKSNTKGSRSALWLGPDEWLIIDSGRSNPAEALAKTRVLHSSVDVSHRNTAVVVNGVGSLNVLSAGCPQDLRPNNFPVGACSRTIYGKAEVVIWRTGKDAFRIECWRSFSTYVFDFLEDAARDANA